MTHINHIRDLPAASVAAEFHEHQFWMRRAIFNTIFSIYEKKIPGGLDLCTRLVILPTSCRPLQEDHKRNWLHRKLEAWKIKHYFAWTWVPCVKTVAAADSWLSGGPAWRVQLKTNKLGQSIYRNIRLYRSTYITYWVITLYMLEHWPPRLCNRRGSRYSNFSGQRHNNRRLGTN